MPSLPAGHRPPSYFHPSEITISAGPSRRPLTAAFHDNPAIPVSATCDSVPILWNLTHAPGSDGVSRDSHTHCHLYPPSIGYELLPTAARSVTRRHESCNPRAGGRRTMSVGKNRSRKTKVAQTRLARRTSDLRAWPSTGQRIQGRSRCEFFHFD